MKFSLRGLDLREFGDWPLLWRSVACMVLALLACGLPWALLTRQISAELQALVVASDELQLRLRQAGEQVDALPALPPSPPETTNVVALPPPDMSALMAAMAEAAQAAGLRDGQFRPQPAAADAQAEEGAGDQIEVRLHGTWLQLGRFASDLTALTPDATLGVREIRLRASPAAALLELSAIVSVYSRPTTDFITLSEPVQYTLPERNPFADHAVRSGKGRPQTVVGSIRTGLGQAGLVLGEDGQLRRVVKTSGRE